MKTTKKILKYFLIFLLIILTVYFLIFLYAKYYSKLSIKTAGSYYLYDNDNKLYNSGSEDWISIDNISKNLINATVSIEDKKFYKHHGFDYLRIIKALFINITNFKTLQGASTITQQYAKNLFLEFDKTWIRKIKEAWITIELEAKYNKDEILEGYLNTINYGGVYGIENASMYYFGKHASELDLAEASLLAGIPKSPANYSPIANYDKAKERQNIILDSMVKNGYITSFEKEEAYKKEFEFVGKNNLNNLSTLMYFEDAVINELKTIKQIPETLLETGGLKVYTTLDMEAMKNLENKIKNHLENSKLEVAAVLMDPNSGQIKAIAGGKDYSKSQFNRVTSSKRQVGSTIKPFLYYKALENGMTASTTFTSEKTNFTISKNNIYSPTNYDNVYANKQISMGAAIAYSDNIYAVKTHLFLGTEELVNITNKFGITSKMENIPSSILGTSSINILEMIKAYGILANGGYNVTPHFIKKIEDINGNVLYEYNDKKDLILNPSIVFILNNLLTGCYNKNFIDYTYPTCMSIGIKMSKKYAIKTGTTNTDHLIFGYNKDAILGIWLGYDDNSKSDIKDGNIMKNIWVEVMEEYLKNKNDNWYTMPDDVVGVMVDPISGKITDKSNTIYYYIKGTQPLK